MLPENDKNRDSSNPDSEAAKPESAAPAVPPAVTPTEPQEAPPILNAPADDQTPPKVYTAGDFWLDERNQREQADNELRNDPELRMEMCRVIGALGHMLDDHAAALGHQEGDGGAYNMDIKKDLLTWMLAEFLTRSIIDRNPDEPPMTRGWQVDQHHAFDFFRVNKYGDESLVALEVEANRS